MRLARRLTDEEYVSRVRKRDRDVRRTQWMWPIVLVAMFYCLAQGPHLVLQYTSRAPVSKQYAYTMLALGFVYGVFLLMVATQAAVVVWKWIESRRGFRTERLMLRYHDELIELKALNKAPEATSEPAPNAASSAPRG
jgi:hypothetical protein